MRYNSIMTQKEKQNIEWKESWRDDYLKTVCAFANTEGGKLIVGKDDDGLIVGLDNARKLLEDLPNKIKDLLGLVCEVNLKEDDEKEYIEIAVEHYSVPISYRGKYYVRSGSTTQLLSGTSLNDFLLKKTGLDWDEVIEPRSTLDDIDPSAIDAFREEAMKAGRLPFIEKETSTEKILRNLRLLNEDGQLKRAAVLLFGKDPRKYFMSAFLKIGKFGESSSDLLAQDTIESNAFELADRAMEVLDAKYFLKSISYDGLHRIETPDYPYAAIREVLLNAIVHRLYETSAISVKVYEDRLVIWNIGELPSQLSLKDLKEDHDSYPRNHLLAEVFYKGGYIESWGRGTIKVLEECEKHGLPEPLIEERGGGVSVTFFKELSLEALVAGVSLNERQETAIVHIDRHGFITNSTYQELTDTSRRTALRDLDDLVENRVIIKEGEGKGTRYRLRGRRISGA
jgi:ATP-dependent DNA helicase RecG